MHVCNRRRVDAVRPVRGVRARSAFRTSPLVLADGRDDALVGFASVLVEELGALGRIDRALVVLRVIEGRTYRYSAAALGLSESAARKRVERALERLGRGLAAHGFDPWSEACDGEVAEVCHKNEPRGDW